MSRRGWIIEKAESSRPVDVVLAEFFDRVERVVASRLGAGQPIETAFVLDRWVRELEGDLLDKPQTARAVVERLAKRLEPVETIPDLRRVLAPLKDRTVRIAQTVEASTEEVSPHVLYRLFTSSGTLLYIGITDRGPQRWTEHARSKSWFGAVSRFEIERLPTREHLAEAERRAIASERPLYNVIHNRNEATG